MIISEKRGTTRMSHRLTVLLPLAILLLLFSGMVVGVWIPGQDDYVVASGVADTATGEPVSL